MKTSVTLLVVAGAGLVFVSGCQNTEVNQKAGTTLRNDGSGGYEVVTYVSPEEYERLTPEERRRLNADIGVKVRTRLSGKDRSKPRDVTQAEVDRAMKEASRSEQW